MSAIGTKRTSRVALQMSTFGGKADIQPQPYLSAIGVIADIDEPAPRGGIKKTYAINTAERRPSPKHELISRVWFLAVDKGFKFAAWVYAVRTQDNLNATSLQPRRLPGNASARVWAASLLSSRACR